VLIVDDDRLILATLSKGLKQAGCETVQGASGEEALRLVAEHVPDLAVLSLIGNKRQTCSCGGSSDRTSSSPVPVPCPEINSNPAGRVTNHVEPSLRKRYAGAGVYLFLDKTMEFHKVREALAASDGEHLERHRMMGLADAGVLEPRHPGASPSPFSSAATTW
jgi:DNA-binding NarL/FixJ family response regulator